MAIDDASGGRAGHPMIIYSPLRGRREVLANVDDPGFSQKLLGDGLAIRPETGAVYSPTAGRVVMTFPTKHAVGITSDDGAEILIHIGLDTVGMGGDGFEMLTEPGERVEVGDPLVAFDIEKIIEAGCDPITVMIVTNTPAFSEIRQVGNAHVQPGDPVLEAVTK